MPASLVTRFENHLKRNFPLQSGDVLAAAVSGGSDSLALFYLLLDIRESLGIELAMGHVRHGLTRPADAWRVKLREIAAAHEILFVETDISSDLAAAEGAVEERAREWRMHAFAAWVHDRKFRAVLTGHTMNDQAETVLMRLVQGSGLPGISAIHPVMGHIWRPLLSFQRHELRNWLESRGIEWFEDPMNDDPTYLRVRARNTWLPVLLAEAPNLPDTLADLSAWAREDNQHFEIQVRRFRDWHERVGPHGERFIPLGLLKTLDRAVRIRFWRSWFNEQESWNRSGFDQLDEADHRALSEEPPPFFYSREGERGGVSCGWVWMDDAPDPPEPVEWVLDESPTMHWDGVRLEAERVNGPAERPGQWELHLPGDTSSVVLRPAADGDRIALASGGHQKISDVFINARVPLPLRESWPLLECGGKVAWVLGLRGVPAPGGAGGRWVIRLVEPEAFQAPRLLAAGDPPC